MPRLSRHCEVPEFKHACLGGVYALKARRALRGAATRGDKLAIVVCADVAEYERGSSGEQTQGAGAVAMLVEREAAAVRGRPRSTRAALRTTAAPTSASRSRATSPRATRRARSA